MTERARLTDALAARPREREYAIHDTTLQGFMLRVQPNGARSWVFRFRRSGKPEAVKADQARAAELAIVEAVQTLSYLKSAILPALDRLRGAVVRSQARPLGPD